MSFGTLYTHDPTPRSTAILALAKSEGLELEIVFAEKDKHPDGYEKLLKVNPLGQVPTFVGADGYVLTECIPITLYIASQSDTSTLLGSTRREYYDILRWMSFGNGDLLPAIGGCLLPLIGRSQIIRQDSDSSLVALKARLGCLEDHLAERSFLVGEQLTVADLMVAAFLAGAFVAWHKVMESEYAKTSRWFYAVYDTPIIRGVVSQLPKYNLPFPVLKDE
ncbi:glutathione S-transferase [Aspergillus floccosus]